MLQIIKKSGHEGYENILSELNLSQNENVMISEAVNGDRIDGYGIYEISKEEIIVYSVSCGGDLTLADGILRSILFLAALKGIERAVLLNGAELIAKQLGIVKAGNILEPISDIFTGCEGCK